VLELGSSTGRMSEMLRQRGCHVTAVDTSVSAGTRAAGRADRFMLIDLESPNWPEQFRDEQFDIVIAADVIEHLRNPLELLGAVSRVLAPDGKLILSIPNVAHGTVRLALLSGRFEYSEIGLLDRTHVHHYTWKEILLLLEHAGWHHVEKNSVRLPIESGLFGVTWDDAIIDDHVFRLVTDEADADVFQYIVTAVPDVPLTTQTSKSTTVQENPSSLERAQGIALSELDDLVATLRAQILFMEGSRFWRLRNRLRQLAGRGDVSP
jgi:SAM-dependent methyltransferase